MDLHTSGRRGYKSVKHDTVRNCDALYFIRYDKY